MEETDTKGVDKIFLCVCKFLSCKAGGKVDREELSTRNRYGICRPLVSRQ